MLVQLQEYISADIQVYYNIILMYVDNVYLGISFPPHFPDVKVEFERIDWRTQVDVASANVCEWNSWCGRNPRWKGLKIVKLGNNATT